MQLYGFETTLPRTGLIISTKINRLFFKNKLGQSFFFGDKINYFFYKVLLDAYPCSTFGDNGEDIKVLVILNITYQYVVITTTEA